MAWEKVKLGEVFEFQKKSKIKANDGLNSGKYPFYTSSEILSKYLNEYKYENEALIFGTGGKASIHYNEGKFSVSTDCFVTIPSNDKIFTKYIYYYLFGNIYILERGFKGAGLKHISKDYISQIEIPLPPLSIQKEIVERLDKADALRQKDQELVVQYDHLAQALFIDLFGDPVTNEKGWERKKLGEVAEINPRKKEIENIDRNLKVTFLEMANVSENGEIILNDVRKIDDVWSGFTYFAENDVLMAKITPCMENGKGAIMKFLVNGYGFGSTEFHVLRPKKLLTNSYWIYAFTKTKVFRESAKKNMRGAAGQKRVPREFLHNYSIPLPPISLQNQFAEMIENIEAQKAKAKKQAEESENLFQALLQEAFGGK